MEKEKLLKLNHYLIALLFLAQPFIVMFQATIVRDIQFLGFSVFEFFNIILALISMGLCIYTSPQKKKFMKFIPYVILLGIYTLLHGWNIYQFNQGVYSYQEPNFLIESYYIFRTFVVPLLLLFNVYYSQMTKEQIFKILEIFAFVISIVIVVTNILHVGQRSYSDETIYNTLSIFDWFNFNNSSRYSYYTLTTKGWFLSANQMSAIFFMSYPLVLWRAYDKREIKNYVLAVLCTLAMFMLGTKTANMGSLLIIGMFIVLWCFFKLLRHKSHNIWFFIVVLVAFCALFPFSPLGYKMSYEKNHSTSGGSNNSGDLLQSAVDVDTSDTEGSTLDYEKLVRESIILKDLDTDNMTENDLIFVRDYMAEFCEFFGISSYIVEHYNDLEHSHFWAKYMQETPNNDYRVMKTMILQNIYEQNHNPLDKYLGLGYTLNYIYTESDYSYQFYIYGLIGFVTLIGPYFALLGYVIIQGLRHFKEMFTLECALYFISPALGLCIANFSGHVLERTLPLMVLAWLMSILLLHTQTICTKNEIENR